MEAKISVGKSETMTNVNNEDRPPVSFGRRLFLIVSLYNPSHSLFIKTVGVLTHLTKLFEIF